MKHTDKPNKNILNRRNFIAGTLLTLVTPLALSELYPLLSKGKKSGEKSIFSSTQLQVLTLLAVATLPDPLSKKSLKVILNKAQSFLITLPQDRLSEFKEILAIFESGLLTKWLTNTPNTIQSERDAKNFLTNWKNSTNHILLEKKLYYGYKALTELFFMVFYSTPEGRALSEYVSFYESV